MAIKQKKQLSFWQIWNMSFGFLGIQFGFALQNANVSRIFETLGANIEDIPILWIAAPVTGLLIQPIIGHMSDNTWGKLGRRRPYFLFGAIFASLALIIMPNSPTLWVAAGMLWIMDASINVSMEPFRAFVGDMLPQDQRTRGFAMQSFFIGTGAVVASLLPYIMTNLLEIPNTALEGEIPPSVKYSFYIGGLIFILAVAWTVFRTKEYSPKELEEFEASESVSSETNTIDSETYISKSNKIGLIALTIGVLLSVLFFYIDAKKEVFILSFGLAAFGILELYSAVLQKFKKKGGFVSVLNDLNMMPKTMKQLAIVQFFSWFALFAMWIYTTNGVTAEKYDMKVDENLVSFLQNELKNVNDTSDEKVKDISKELTHYKTKLNSENKTISTNVNLVKFFLNDKIFTEKELITHIETAISSKSGKEISKIKEHLSKIKNEKSPNIDYESVSYINELLKNETINLPEEIKGKFSEYTRLKLIRKEYNDGADWVGVGFGVYNGFAAVFAFFLMFLARKTSRKITHSISLIVGGISFIALFFIDNQTLLLVPFIGIGLAWASILAMPYAILTGSLPSNKMGTYMGIFNFFIVIPQILAASLLGFFIKQLFAGEAIYALILGGISMFIAAILVVFVKDDN